MLPCASHHGRSAREHPMTDMEAAAVISIAFIKRQAVNRHGDLGGWLARAFHEAGQPVLLADAGPDRSALDRAGRAGGFPSRIVHLPRPDLDKRIAGYTRPDDLVITGRGQLEDQPVSPGPCPARGDPGCQRSGTRRRGAACCSTGRPRTPSSTAAARQALAAAGFTVPGMTVPRPELYAQSYGAPAGSAGPRMAGSHGRGRQPRELAEAVRRRTAGGGRSSGIWSRT